MGGGCGAFFEWQQRGKFWNQCFLVKRVGGLAGLKEGDWGGKGTASESGKTGKRGQVALPRRNWGEWFKFPSCRLPSVLFQGGEGWLGFSEK